MRETQTFQPMAIANSFVGSVYQHGEDSVYQALPNSRNVSNTQAAINRFDENKFKAFEAQANEFREQYRAQETHVDALSGANSRGAGETRAA